MLTPWQCLQSLSFIDLLEFSGSMHRSSYLVQKNFLGFWFEKYNLDKNMFYPKCIS